MKQAVIAPSMMYLLYPLHGEIKGYSKEEFVEDLVNECEKDIRGCFDAGAQRVSIDFTEGRLASKKDPRNPWTEANLLQTFIDLNNKVFRLLFRRGTKEHRDPHMPWRRLRFSTQWRGRLSRAFTKYVPDECWIFFDPAGE